MLVAVPQVQAGQAAPAELQREQEKLGQMDSQLQGLQTNYNKMKDQAASLLQRMGTSGAEAAADGSAKAASGITGAMYAGLKFSGLAMRIAADVVSSVTDDAGKMLRVRTWHTCGWFEGAGWEALSSQLLVQSCLYTPIAPSCT